MDKILNARLLAGVSWAAFFVTMGGMVAMWLPADATRSIAALIFFAVAAFSSIIASGSGRRAVIK